MGVITVFGQERRALDCIAERQPHREIAARLSLAETTKDHVSRDDDR